MTDFATLRAFFNEPRMVNDYEILGADAGADDVPLLLGRAVPTDRFSVLAQQGAGCLFALWRKEESMTWADAPVVWLDSEGDPTAPIASSLAEFVSLVLVRSGAVYDALRAAERASDATRAELVQKWSERTATEREKTRDEYEDMGEQHLHDELLRELDRLQITPAANVFTVIDAAFQRHGSLREWADQFPPT